MAIYDGGAENYSTHVRFICSLHHEYGEIQLDQVGKEFWAGAGSMSITVFSRDACPRNINFRKPIAGGAYFLLIICLILLLYIVGGGFVTFIFQGHISVPFENILLEFGLSVKTAIYFIFTCGKVSSTTLGAGSPSYGKM
jgi:hypothetical protein